MGSSLHSLHRLEEGQTQFSLALGVGKTNNNSSMDSEAAILLGICLIAHSEVFESQGFDEEAHLALKRGIKEERPALHLEEKDKGLMFSRLTLVAQCLSIAIPSNRPSGRRSASIHVKVYTGTPSSWLVERCESSSGHAVLLNHQSLLKDQL